jgi:hypothetical protein
MRKRRGIYLPLPRVRRPGNGDRCHGNDETDNEAPEHEWNLSKARQSERLS